MRLKQLTVRNFRGYKDCTSIGFDALTAIIGKNNIGKSTLLEALAIFFENDTVKVESEDLNVMAREKVIMSLKSSAFFVIYQKSLLLILVLWTTLTEENLSYSENDQEFLCIYRH